MARSPAEEQRSRRRKRLVQGLILGGAAVGVPALINLAVARRALDVPDATWGSRDVYRFETGATRGEATYQRLGQGEPLLLLHAFGPGHSSSEWRRAAEELARSFEVFAPDLPGWGRSDIVDGPVDPGFYVDWLKDFTADVIGRPTAVVAAGLPAAYALHLAAREPNRIRALGLIVPLGLESYGREPELRDTVIHRMLRSPVLGTSALNVFTSRSSIATYLRREVFASPHVVDDALIDLHYTNSHRPGCQRVLAAYVSGFLNHSIKNLLERVRQPIWLAWGRKAAGSGVEAADLWLLKLAQAELEIFEQAGILPHAESPEEFARKLQRFVLDLSQPDKDELTGEADASDAPHTESSADEPNGED